MNEYLERLDLYAVEKLDYDSYVYRCKDRNLMKVTPNKELTVFRDVETGKYLYGYGEIELVKGLPHKTYYIFELLDEELLGEPLRVQHLNFSQEELEQLLVLLGVMSEDELKK